MVRRDPYVLVRRNPRNPYVLPRSGPTLRSVRFVLSEWKDLSCFHVGRHYVLVLNICTLLTDLMADKELFFPQETQNKFTHKFS